nr:MAG TPA: hypothetical protein [Caudoviricetes sp.]
MKTSGFPRKVVYRGSLRGEPMKSQELQGLTL